MATVEDIKAPNKPDKAKKPEKPKQSMVAIPDNTTVCLGEATPDNPMAIRFDGNGFVVERKTSTSTATNPKLSAEDRAAVAMRGFQRNRTKVYQELSKLDAQGNPLDAQAMPMYGSDGVAPEGSHQLCVMGPDGVHKTFDFTGMSREQRTSAAADAVMEIGASCAPPGYELTATAQGVEIISRPDEYSGEPLPPPTAKKSKLSDYGPDVVGASCQARQLYKKWAQQAQRCVETNTIHNRPEVRIQMALYLMRFSEQVDAPTVYSNLVKMACLAPALIKDNFQQFSDFIVCYTDLLSYMVRQPQCANVARAFGIFYNAIGLKHSAGGLIMRREAHAHISTAFTVVRTQLAAHCPYDTLSNFDNQPLWRAIVDGNLCFYKRDGEFVLRSPEAMEMEVSLAAEALLQEEDEAKATSKAVPSSGKAAKRRARQKQKKEKERLVPLEAIGEEEEVVTPVAEEAAPPVAPDEASVAPAPDSGVFNLSDIGSALTNKQDDAATSVATALMCIICYSKERSVACVPCGHKCLCEDCGTKENMTTAKGCPCPMCRKEVIMFMKVFE